jgi:hypothetical protein
MTDWAKKIEEAASKKPVVLSPVEGEPVMDDKYDKLFDALAELTESSSFKWSLDASAICRLEIPVLHAVRDSYSLTIQMGDSESIRTDASQRLAKAAKTQYEKAGQRETDAEMQKEIASVYKKYGKTPPTS